MSCPKCTQEPPAQHMGPCHQDPQTNELIALQQKLPGVLSPMTLPPICRTVPSHAHALLSMAVSLSAAFKLSLKQGSLAKLPEPLFPQLQDREGVKLPLRGSSYRGGQCTSHASLTATCWAAGTCAGQRGPAPSLPSFLLLSPAYEMDMRIP